MIIKKIAPTASEYVALRMKSGMGFKEEKMAEIALNNSLFCVSVWIEENLIGFGRVVGDGGITFIVSDIMVDAEHQGKGIGKIIMKEIDDYLETHTDEHAYICLLAVKPADQLYLQYNFEYAEPKLTGMKRRQKAVV